MGSRPSSRSKARKRPARHPVAPRRRSAYHHGDLRNALIEATLRLVAEGGPATVTVSAAARRAGVSSGAPFRHFPSRKALMTAVAEEATSRLRESVERALARTAGAGPRTRFREFCLGYLGWALDNPAHFQVISDRSLIDYESSIAIRTDNTYIRARLAEVMAAALGRRRRKPADFAHLQLAVRAMAYGLARMVADGHFAQWKIAGFKVERSLERVIDLLIDGMMSPPKRS